MRKIGVNLLVLKSRRGNYTALKFASAAVLCFSFITSYAASPIATVSFTATIDRVAAPDGVSLPGEIKKGKQVDGSISFVDGSRRDAHSKRDLYFWIADAESGTTSLKLGTPLNALIEHLITRVDSTKRKINIVCDRYCKKGGGINLGGAGPSWQISRFFLLAPGAVPADLSQIQAIERLVEFGNSKQSKILLNYKQKPDDSDVKALRVILSIDSMTTH